MLKYFRNRKSMGWLVGSMLLGLVIVAFVVLYIPDFMTPAGAGGLAGDVAWVDGAPVSGQEFQRSYRAQENQYRQQLGSQFNPDLMRQLGFDNLVIQQLLQNKMLLLEAEAQGISVTNEEVRDVIMTFPQFQTDGSFIGRDAYLMLLAQNGLTASGFENTLREDLMRQKLQSLVTDGVIVNEADVRDEYRKRNEQLHLDYVFVPKSDFTAEVEVSPEDARAYYEANREEFSHPVQRKVRFITFTPQLFTSAVTVTDREVERYYNQNLFMYETQEQVAASHILFKTGPDKDEGEVRSQAEAVLARAKAGEDFAELAREFSEDTSAEEGGDLGFFGRGQMVPEFEQAAFSLAEGEISDLVQTTYGFHIIKKTGSQPAFIRPLEDVKEEIRGTIAQEKAREEMEKAVDSAATKLRGAGSIDALVAEYELIIPQDTEFFSRDEALPQLSNSRDATRVAFETPVASVSPPIRLGNGFAFLQVLEERPAGVPEFEAIEATVTARAREHRVMELAKARALELRPQLADGGEPEGVEVHTTESFFRGSRLPEAGDSAAVQATAFDLDVGDVSEPLPAANGYVLLRVVEKTGFDPADFAAQKADFTQQILNEQKLRVWNAYVASLESRHDVRIDWQAIRSLTG